MSAAKPLVDAAVELLRLDPEGWRHARCGVSSSLYQHLPTGMSLLLAEGDLVLAVDSFVVGYFERRILRAEMMRSAAMKARLATAEHLLDKAGGPDRREPLDDDWASLLPSGE